MNYFLSNLVQICFLILFRLLGQCVRHLRRRCIGRRNCVVMPERLRVCLFLRLPTLGDLIGVE